MPISRPGYQFAKRKVDFKAPAWVDFKALVCKGEVNFKAPEKGPFEAPGRTILRRQRGVHLKAPGSRF